MVHRYVYCQPLLVVSNPFEASVEVQINFDTPRMESIIIDQSVATMQYNTRAIMRALLLYIFAKYWYSMLWKSMLNNFSLRVARQQLPTMV